MQPTATYPYREVKRLTHLTKRRILEKRPFAANWSIKDFVGGGVVVPRHTIPYSKRCVVSPGGRVSLSFCQVVVVGYTFPGGFFTVAEAGFLVLRACTVGAVAR